MKMTREIYIPKNATKVAHKESDAVAYISKNRNGFPCAMLFVGRRSKPEWNFWFRDEKIMMKKIENYFKNRAEYTDRKKTSSVRNVKVGDILVSTWGYDQTNVDFYQVTELVGAKSARIIKIRQNKTETGYMSGTTVPNTSNDASTDVGQVVRINDRSAKINGCHASVWDGKPVYWSSYA